MIADWISTGLINACFKQFTFISKLITALLITRLLLLARFRPAVLSVSELSHALRTFLCFHLAGAIVTMPYNAYVPIAYYTAKSDDEYAMFWFGQLQNTYTAISPLAVLFLTLERCFVIKLATNPAKMASIERLLRWIGIGTLLAAFTASTLFYMDELPLNLSQLNEIGCQSVSCLMGKWHNIPQLVFKCTISTLNIFGCSYLLYSFHAISSAMIKKKNHHVIVTICFSLTLDFLPALISIIFSLFDLGLISNLASTCTVLDSLCCAIHFTLFFVPFGWVKRRVNVNAVGSSRNNQLMQPHQEQHQGQQLHRTAPFVSLNPIQLQNNCNTVTKPQMIHQHGYGQEMMPIGTVAQSSEEDCKGVCLNTPEGS